MPVLWPALRRVAARLMARLTRRSDSRPLGQRGEDAAARYLWWRGYTIVARQHRLPYGELDLVAVRRRTVVFVEVKTRRSHGGGHPAETVSRQQQERIGRAALAFLKQHDLLEQRVRFDIVAVTWPAKGRPRIEHFPNAFRPPDLGSMFG